MGIDISRLSPSAQAQIARKIAAQDRARLEQQQKKQSSKYHNIPTTRQPDEGKKIRFQSKKEAQRYDELMLLLKAEKISDLKLQADFTLQEAYTLPNGNRVRAIRYKADFTYRDENGDFVVEDTKSKATKTRVYSVKQKLMLEKFGIEIREL